MNIEKALRNYLNCNGPKVKEKDFFQYANGDANASLDVLFSLIDDEIESINEKKALDRVVEVLKLAEILIRNNDGINRKVVSRRIVRLETKMDRILSERKKSFYNIKKIRSEFRKVERQLDSLLEITSEKDTKQYDFMSFLIDETRNIEYLEYTLKKMPSLANVKDKNEIPLFRNIIRRYLRSVYDSEEADTFYFDNLISLILSQKSFNLTENTKRDCLEDIYKFLDQTAHRKKGERRKINTVPVNQLIERLKGTREKKEKITNIANKFKVHVFFEPHFQEQVKLVKKPMEGEMTDREEVKDYVVSIDKPESVEIDDALSCRILPNGNFLLGVHIASVLGYFPYESEIVQEAIYRRSAIYLPEKYQTVDDDFHRTVPIFPYSFAADKGSLLEGEPRLTRSYYFEISPTGEVVNEWFKKTITRNNKRITYQQADEILQKEPDGSQLKETLDNLSKVTTILGEKYKGSDLYNQIKENKEDLSDLRVKRQGSENIVFQSMLLTGNRVAEFFARNGYPALYRVHEIDEETNLKLQALIDNLNQTYGGEQFKNLYQLIDGIYPKGWYAMEGRHSGLDLDHYCHITSLLRRAPDIVMEHALEVCYDKTPTPEELEALRQEIEEKAKLINAREPQMEYFVREYQKKYRRR